MRTRSETIVLLDSRPFTTTAYAEILAEIGYWQVLYGNYLEASGLVAGGAAADAVVAVWTAETVAVDRFARAVAEATRFPRVRGALVVSPFTTEPNARLLARSGARAWARPPVSKSDLAGRLNVLLHGDRRVVRDNLVLADRRRQPLYPLAVPA